MKNQTKWAIPDFSGNKLLLLIMKGYLLLFCTLAMGMNTDKLFSQKSVYVESDKLLTVDQVFDLIMEQTDYNFIYQVDLFTGKPKVSLKKGKIKVDKLLEKSLANSSVTLDVTDSNTIVIQPKTMTKGEQQNIVVNGVVTDEQGVPLPGVTVRIKDLNRGVATDFDGKYQIKVPDETSILVFTSIGYQSRELGVGSQRNINVQMAESVSQLDEVVVNAGYYNVSKREITGNISKITTKEIERQPVVNPLQGLQGRMPGVNIVQSSGVPGSGFKVEIRGRNSLRSDGNKPLYIIDGVPFSGDGLGSNLISQVLPVAPESGINPLSSINPSDIESIEILKDADATAIYGSRGANGVVLITTKKGAVGKTTFDLKYSSGVGQITRKHDLLNTPEYLEMRREAYENDGIVEIPSSAYDVNGTWDQNKYTDWQKKLIGGLATQNNIQASVSGGNKNTQFLWSGGYIKSKTVFPGDYANKKITTHLNVNHRSENDKLKLNLSATYGVDKNDYPGLDLTRDAIRLAPNAPDLYDENGDVNWEDGTFRNPIAYLETDFRSTINNLLANANISYEVLRGLTLKSSLGFTDLRLDESYTSPNTVYNPSYGYGPELSSNTLGSTRRQSWIIEPQISYDIALGNKSELKLLVGSTFQEESSNSLEQYAYGFTSNSLIYDVGSASDIILVGNNENTYRYSALFGRINYNMNNRYFLNITGRRDGSSRFGTGNRFANFGAIGASWIFSDENFFQNHLGFLSFGKLRASYGTTGSDQIGDYQYLDTYTSTPTIYNGVVGMEPTRLFNPDFAWETNKKFEVTLELGLFNNRINLNSSYYKNRSSNQLVGIPLSGVTGFTSIQSNLNALVQNTGVEFELSTQNIRNENLSWTSSFNLTVPRNKLVEYDGLESSTYANTYVVGEPLDIRKLYNYTGVDPQTGLYTFQDYNGDGNISFPDDRVVVERIGQEFYGGFNNSIQYGNLSVDLFFQFVKQSGYNYLYSFGRPGVIQNQPRDVLDRWQTPGDVTDIQQFSISSSDASRAFSNLNNSTMLVDDASFIRLKNVSISYDLPENISKSFTARIFFLAQNLLTFTNYKGADPENYRSQHALPPLRMLTLGLELKL